MKRRFHVCVVQSYTLYLEQLPKDWNAAVKVKTL